MAKGVYQNQELSVIFCNSLVKLVIHMLFFHVTKFCKKNIMIYSFKYSQACVQRLPLGLININIDQFNYQIYQA